MYSSNIETDCDKWLEFMKWICADLGFILSCFNRIIPVSQNHKHKSKLKL